MKQVSLFHRLVYIFAVWIVSAFSIGAAWLIGSLIIVKLLAELLPGVDVSGGEGAFAIGVIAIGLSPVIALSGLIPAYFLSMNLAKWLRVKRGWQLPHPRRLFVFSVLAPLLILALMILALQRP